MSDGQHAVNEATVKGFTVVAGAIADLYERMKRVESRLDIERQEPTKSPKD